MVVLMDNDAADTRETAQQQLVGPAEMVEYTRTGDRPETKFWLATCIPCHTVFNSGYQYSAHNKHFGQRELVDPHNAAKH